MKRTAPIVMVIAGLLVAGCAHTGSRTGSGEELDSHYIQAVNSSARKHGTQVIWVNPPTRASEEDRRAAAGHTAGGT